MSEKSPTPDLLPRFQRRSHLDIAEHGQIGRDNSPEIAHNALGPKHDLDDNRSAEQHTTRLETLGAGNSSPSDAAASIPHGARAPKVDWAHIRKG